MPRIRVRNLTRSKVSVGAGVGSLNPGETRILDVTAAQLEALSVDLFGLQNSGSIEWAPETSADSSRDLTSYLPVASSATKTSRKLDLYVTTTGQDSNDGLTPASPLRNLEEAIRRIPDFVHHRVTIHLASGSYSWSTPISSKSMKDHIVIIGDGAGQLNDDGFVELVGSTAAAASSSQTVVKSSGLGVNAYRGKTIEILSGAAAGDRRTIRDNTATDITPVRQFTAAVVDGDLYRIVEPAVTIDVQSTGGKLLVDSLGGNDHLNALGLSSMLVPSLAFVNVAFTQAALGINKFSRANVVMYGVERDVSTTWTISGSVAFGCDSKTGYSELGAILTGLTSTAWAGWGAYASDGSLIVAAGDCYGFLVHIDTNGVSVQYRARFHLIGGSIENNTTSAAIRADATGVSDLSEVEVGTASSAIGITPLVTNLSSGPALSLGGSNRPSKGVLHRGTFTSTTGTAVLLRGMAECLISNNVTGTGGVGIDASYGAKAYCGGAVGITGSGGNDLTVDAGSTYGTAASLGSAGAARFNATNGSAIIRTA